PPFAEIITAIEEHSSFLIAGHVGPDGDAIGTGLALQLALTAFGKQAWMVSTDGVPPTCRFLPGWQSVTGSPPRQPQCALIIDCNGMPNRVAAPYHFIENARYKVLIDHHRTSQPIFDVNWIDPALPATALMAYQLLQRLSITFTADIAQCLLCGLSTDTGNFRFPNTTPEALYAAGDLVKHGADPAVIAFKLFDERSFEATKLLGIALQKMRAECGGALTWTALTADDFQAAGTGDESSENVVNMLRNVRHARMAIILRESCDETGPVARVSVRADTELRADLFCQQFGGGGHAAASGCRVRHQPFADSVRLIIGAACAWLNEDHPPVEDAAN
ncbi:MAG: bifunctional oligoribonuclease/PAP phosphatase NrnA, partial [Armatimonadota bacterium]|nr:bifunctional oligoribonuclease/PAP phosphatase NrnA [Armatimonadota bacterium]